MNKTTKSKSNDGKVNARVAHQAQTLADAKFAELKLKQAQEAAYYEGYEMGLRNLRPVDYASGLASGEHFRATAPGPDATNGCDLAAIERSIPVGLGRLSDALHLMSDRLNALEGRLSPALRSQPECGNKAESKVAACALSDNLESMRAHAMQMCVKLGDLLDRLEL